MLRAHDALQLFRRVGHAFFSGVPCSYLTPWIEAILDSRSMGCVSSLALGLALARPDLRVVALDGDGALFLRMGALATIGHERPQNLVHVLLDNGVHDSTGSQETVSSTVDLAQVAVAAGYARSERVEDARSLTQAIAAAAPGPHFVHLRALPRASHALPRPRSTPPEVAERLRRLLAHRARRAGAAPNGSRTRISSSTARMASSSAWISLGRSGRRSRCGSRLPGSACLGRSRCRARRAACTAHRSRRQDRRARGPM